MEITKERVKNFLKKYQNYFIVFAIWFLILNLAFISSGVWPYGSNTLAGSDTYVQICAFFEQIFAWLRGETSLFYNANIAGGVEILSTLMYMLINPFYILVLVCGAKNIYTSINYAMFFMFLFNGFVMLWFLNKRFGQLSSWWKVLFSSLFAFCVYNLYNFAFATWYIFPGICLLLFDAFLDLVQNKKIWRFSCILAWFIINSVTLSISSFLIIVLLFFAYIMFLVSKEAKKETFVRLFVGVAIGALISLIILTPAIYALLKTNRTSSFFGTMLDKTVKLDYFKFSVLMLEFSIFVFPIIYVVEIFKTNKREFYFCLSSMIVLLLPFLFNFITSALTGGTINSLTSRYYFVTEVFMFLLSIKFVDKKLQAKTNEETNHETTGPIKIISICIIALSIFVSILAIMLMFKTYPTHIKNVDDDEASLIVTLFLFVFYLISFFMVYIGFNFKKLSFNFFKKATYVIMCFGLAVSSIIYISPYSFDNAPDTKICQMVTDLQTDGKIKYMTNERLNKLALPLGSNMFFSSLMSREVADSFDSLGYSVNTVYLSSSTGDLIADSLVGNNYYFSEIKLNRPYLTLQSYDKENGYYIYKNNLASSGAVVFDKSYVYDKNASYFKNIENLQSSFGLSGELYEDVTLIKTNNNGKISYSFTASSDKILYVNYPSKNLKFAGEEYVFTTYETPESDKYWSDFIFVAAGETFTFTYNCEIEDNKEYFPKFKALNFESAKTLCEKFIENQAGIKNNKNGFEIKLSGKEGNLFVSSPKIEGYKVLVDGTKIESSTQFGGFLSISVTASQKSITITYNAPYIWIWAVMIIVCSLLIVGLYYWHKKTALKRLETIIYVFWWCLVCCILSVFYLFCILLTFFKLIL